MSEGKLNPRATRARGTCGTLFEGETGDCEQRGYSGATVRPTRSGVASYSDARFVTFRWSFQTYISRMVPLETIAGLADGDN